MIYITQLIYIKEGQEQVFHEFESHAIPIISKYNGELVLRIRINQESVVECTVEQPYEIHLVKFNSDLDFQNFLQDEERKNFLHLKETSIRESILIKGEKI